MNNFISRQKYEQNRFVLHRNETHNISYIICTNLTVVIIRKAIEKKTKYTFSCKLFIENLVLVRINRNLLQIRTRVILI